MPFVGQPYHKNSSSSSSYFQQLSLEENFQIMRKIFMDVVEELQKYKIFMENIINARIVFWILQKW